MVLHLDGKSDTKNALFNEVLHDLLNGKAEFVYEKVNGDLRKAKGTMNPDDINAPMSPESLKYFKDLFDESNQLDIFSMPEYIKYFDLDKNSIRQFSPYHIEKIIK